MKVLGVAPPFCLSEVEGFALNAAKGLGQHFDLGGRRRLPARSKISLADGKREFSEPPRALGERVGSQGHSVQVSNKHLGLAVARDSHPCGRKHPIARDRHPRSWDWMFTAARVTIARNCE